MVFSSHACTKAAPATGAMSTGEGPQQLTGLQMSQTPPQISSLHIQLCTPRLFKHMLKCKACKHICNIYSGTSASNREREAPAPQKRLFWENGSQRDGSTIWRVSAETGAKPQLKSVRQAEVSELYPVYHHQPGTQEYPALAAMLQTRLCYCFTVLGFPSFSINQFCSEGFLSAPYSICKLCYSTSLCTIHFLHESQSGGVRKREVRYHNSI